MNFGSITYHMLRRSIVHIDHYVPAVMV